MQLHIYTKSEKSVRINSSSKGLLKSVPQVIKNLNNNTMKYLTLLVFLLSFITPQAQKKGEVWSAKPEFTPIKEEYKNEKVVGILLKEKYDYSYSDEGNLIMIHTIHKKYLLNNDESINQFNKISVSLNDVIDVVDIKARTIKPNGKSVEFDKKSIKEIKDDESGKAYKIFAIDGIEKGDEVEYYVIRKLWGDNFGRTFFQYSYPLQYAAFEITCPNNLIYDIKGYNGFPNGMFEKLDDKTNRFFCEKKDIDAIKGEKFSYTDPRKERLEYRLDYNTARGRSQKLTWDDAAVRVWESMYLDVDAKIMDKIMEMANIQGATELEKVKAVEEFVKNNIYVEQFNAPAFTDLKFVLENKVSGPRGVVRVYGNILKRLGINHQLALTTERDNVKFDADFQSWNYLDKYLIYFPNLNTYLDPNNVAYRLGTYGGLLTANNALFVKPVKIGDFESAIGEIKYIEPTNYKENYDNMIIDISVDVDNNTTRIINERGFKGLSGGFIANFFKMMDAEQKEKTLKDMNSTKAPNPEYKVLEVRESTDKEPLKNADFLMYADFTTDAFLENAGNKLLLSIGESIGPQVEMYFEEDRKSKAENDHNRLYHREITFHVPDGYKIVNPEVGELIVTEGEGDNKVYTFESTYSYEGNVYKMKVVEFYKNIFVTNEQFEGFKNVVNAAADFNKIVLVLEEE